jgi:tetratricopeptide (TPR) repeat protein
VYKAKGQTDAAIEMYREALRRKPEWASTRAQVAYLLRYRGKWAGAALEMLEAAKRSSRYSQNLARDLPETCYFGALESHEKGKDRLALLMIEAARRRRSPYPAADHYMAFLFSLRAEHDRALPLMEAVARQSPGMPMVAENLERARQREPLLPPTTLQQALAERR